MLKQTVKLTTCTIEIDEHASLSDMQSCEPLFFKTKHGKRETYTVYRGFLIVRNTVQFTGEASHRRTVVYAFSTENGSFCVSSGKNLSGIYEAKELIDHLIDGE